MKTKLSPVLFIALFFISFLIVSCGKNECDSNCDELYPSVLFKVVNSSAQNLVCGANKIYTSDKIKIKSVIAGTLTEATWGFDGDSTQPGTHIAFSPAALSDQYYLYINNVKTDSFQLSYQLLQGKTPCCPAYYKNAGLQLNKVTVTSPFNVVK